MLFQKLGDARDDLVEQGGDFVVGGGIEGQEVGAGIGVFVIRDKDSACRAVAYFPAVPPVPLPPPPASGFFLRGPVFIKLRNATMVGSFLSCLLLSALP